MKRKKILEGVQAAFGNAARQGAEAVKSYDISKMRMAVRPALTFVLSFLLGLVRAPMGVYPFSYGVFCAARGGIDTVFAFLGCAAAVATMGRTGLWQLAILFGLLSVRFIICAVKGDLRKRESVFRKLFRERGYIRVILASAGAAAFGCIGIIDGEGLYYSLFAALLGVGEAALVTAAFVFLEDRSAPQTKRMAGLGVLVLGLTMSLEYFSLPFSLGAVAVFTATIYFSYFGNSALGALVGFAGGFAVGGQYSAAFGAVGLVCPLIWDHSRPLAVCASGAAASVISLFGGGLDAVSDIIPEIAFSTAVAAPLVSMDRAMIAPPAFVDFTLSSPKRTEVERPVQRYDLIGSALSSLSELIRSVGAKMRLPSKEESVRICKGARAKYCSGCIHEKECSGIDKERVDSMFSNMAFRLSCSGRVSAKIVPEPVARRCYNMDGIIDNVNSASKKAASLSGSARKAELFASDYSAIATLLSEISEDDGRERDEECERALVRALSDEGFSFAACAVFGKRGRSVYMYGVDPSAKAGEGDICRCAERILGGRLSSPEFSIDSGVINAVMYSLPRIKLCTASSSVGSNRESTSGDSICSFENPEGYYYTLVSDGMGSGHEAAMASGVTSQFLEKLLSAGCPMRSTLELLNCFIRGAGGETFTTVDLMEVDLYSARARFIKSGAAPSFIIRNGRLFRLHSKTVPVGIMRALDAESLSFDLLEGDTIIMMSDGVSGSFEESPWLYDILAEGMTMEDSPKSIARYIANAAAENTGREDDISVCVMKVKAA